MVRVTRKGGRVVVFDFDWDTLVIDHPDKETTRTIVRSFSDSIQNGWIGRQLPRLVKEQHLQVLSLDPVQVFLHYALTELSFGSQPATASDGSREKVPQVVTFRLSAHEWRPRPMPQLSRSLIPWPQ